MGGFWSTLGSGLENYAKQRLQHNRLTGFIPPHAPANQQGGQQIGSMDTQPAQSSGLPPVTPTDTTAMPQATPDLSQEGTYSGLDAFAGGKIVTQPTTAIVGEKGPEMVVPLNSAPGQKLSVSMMGGPQNTKSRFRQVSGPNALKNVSPLKSDLPLRPNRFVR